MWAWPSGASWRCWSGSCMAILSRCLAGCRHYLAGNAAIQLRTSTSV